MKLLAELKSLRHASVQNRPTPRAVQFLVIATIAAPAVCVGIAGFAVGQILTVNWPRGGAK